jgi:uncharacterized protein DUF4167
MRQGHQNRNRGRNRNNGGSRKGQSPISRSYESNGPDVKIRGTPAHIAEKYMTLARDAQSNGDPVLAENYLQHGEHYNRIILAYRDQMAQQASEGGEQRNGQGGGQRPQRNNNAEPVSYEDAGLEAEGGQDMAAAPQPRSGGGNDQPRGPRQQGRGRSGASNRPRSDRGGASNRRASGRTDSGDDQPSAEASSGGVPEHEQPEFLRRSVKRTRRPASSEQEEQPAVAESSADNAD